MNNRDITGSSASAQNTLELLRKGNREANKRNPTRPQTYMNERLEPHQKGLRPTGSIQGACGLRNRTAENHGVTSRPANLELSREPGTSDLYPSQQDDPLLRIGSEHELEPRGHRMHTIVPVERAPLRGGFRCDGTGHGDHDGIGAGTECAVGARPAGGRFIATNHVSMLGVSIQMLVLGAQISTTLTLWEVER